MKKLFLTLGLATLTLSSAHAQGTINPLNGTLTRIRLDSNGDGIMSTDDRNVTTADGLKLGVFWGVAGGPADTLAGEMTIGSTSGILTGLPAIFAIQGAGDAGTVISLQLRATSPGWFGQTEVKQVRLAPASGPGTVIWSSTGADVNGSGTFRPNFYLVPEPSTLALSALGGLMLLFGLRKNDKELPIKQLLVTLGLAALTLAGANAQGTINPLNGTLIRVRYDIDGDGVYTSRDLAARPSDGLRLGVFWGEAGGPANNFAGVMTIGPVDGVLTGLPPIFSVQGWGDEGTIISLEFCTLAGGGGRTGVKQVTLASADGPGTVVWGSTATASRFGPLLLNLGGPACVVPEPSTLALSGLVCAFLLLRVGKIRALTCANEIG